MRSFFNKMRGHKNRTFHWQAEAPLNEMLTVDLTSHRFGGVAIGDPIEKLSFLGPSDNCYERSEIYDYKKRGFYLVEDEGKLETVVFLLKPDGKDASFGGRWMGNGRSCIIMAQTTPESVGKIMGEPSQADIEPSGELVWLYQFPGLEWEFAWTEAGELESVEMRLPEAG
jgi:hypothetical protein